MRQPPSDDPAAACQGCPGTLPGSEGSQWEQSLGFKGDHCNLNEIVFPLQAFDCDESIRSRFSCLLWNIFFQKKTQDSEVNETGDMWIWKEKMPPTPHRVNKLLFALPLIILFLDESSTLDS